MVLGRFIILSFLCLMSVGTAWGKGCLTKSDFPATLGVFDYPGNNVWHQKVNPVVMGNTFFIPIREIGVAVLRLTDSDQIENLALIPVQNETLNISLADSTLFVAESSGDILVFDVRDPSSPTLINQISTFGDALDVAIVDNFLLVLGSRRELMVYGLGEGGQANYLRSIPFHHLEPMSMEHSGELILVEGVNGKFLVFDVSNPEFPAITYFLDLPDGVRGFAIQDEIVAFIFAMDPMEIWSLADPSQPILVSSCAAGSSPGNVQILGEFAFVTTQDGILAVNVSDIHHPDVVYRHNPETSYFSGFGLIGNRLIAVRDQIELIDFSNQSSPTVRGEVSIPNSWAGRCLIHDDLAIVAAYNDSINIISIANPSLPRVTFAGRLGHNYALAAKDHVLILSGDGYGTDINFFDISNPHQPAHITTRFVGGVPRHMMVRDDLLVVLFNGGFSLWDVSDPLIPHQLATQSLPWIQSGALKGNYLYLACDREGLFVWDISTLSDPTFVTSYPGTNWPRGVTAAGDALFVFNHTSYEGVQIFDISDPELLVLRNTLNLRSEVDGGWIQGKTFFMRANDYFIHALDITNPFEPEHLGIFGQSERYFDVEGNEDLLILTGWPNILEVYDNPCSFYSTPPEPRNRPAEENLCAFPNPFNPQTTIRFNLPEPGPIEIEIYDISGRRVWSLETPPSLSAGDHEFVWNGNDRTGRQLASGTYFLKIRGGGFQASKRLVLLK